MASGYKLYRGVGGLADVDFTAAVATIAAGESHNLVGEGHTAGVTYTYVLRAYIDALESPDISCRAEFVCNDSGGWDGAQPDRVEWLEAEVLSGGDIRLRWEYRTGVVAAADFGIYYGSVRGQADGSPDETVSYTSDGQYTTTLSLSDGTTYWLAVTARTAGSVESDAVEVGPYVADDTGPETPTVYTAQTFVPVHR